MDVELLVLIGRNLGVRQRGGGARGGFDRSRVVAGGGEVGEVALRGGDSFGVVGDEDVAAARDAGMHLRAAHLFKRYLLADHHLRHPRRTEVHRGVAVAHDHDVAEGRNVGAACGAGAEQHADLRHNAGELDLVEEDPSGAAAAGEHLDLVGDSRPGGVDEVDNRNPPLQRALLDSQDLLDRLRAPRAGFDGWVVGHHGYRPPGDGANAGYYAVSAKAVLLPVGEQPFLGE